MTVIRYLLGCALLLSVAPATLAQDRPFGFQYDPHLFWQAAPTQADAQLHFLRRRVDRALKLGYLSHDRANFYYRRLDRAEPFAATVRASREPNYTKPINSNSPVYRSSYGADLGSIQALKGTLHTFAQGLATEIHRNEW